VELSKPDSNVLKGAAILMMVMLHLFARKNVGDLYYAEPLIGGAPWVYYLAIMGDACRQIYLFVTGYAFYLMVTNANGSLLGKNLKRIAKLYVNFWVVFLIFVPIGMMIGDERVFTPDIGRFVLGFLGISNAYNGAWWFLRVYVILVLLSPVLIRFIKRQPSILLLACSCVLFVFGHFQRYRPFLDVGDHVVVADLANLCWLLATSQFSFVIGAVFAKEKLLTRIGNAFANVRYKNFLCISVLAALVVFHGMVQSSIVAPFNSTVMIVAYTLMTKHKVVTNVLHYFSKHSTNIWLMHMFFYLTIFPDITFAPKYPVLIFLWLLLMCIAVSYVVKFITHPLHRMIERSSFFSRRAIAEHPLMKST